MSIQGTGTRDHSNALELRRSFRIRATKLWRYLVDSDYLDQWFGAWQGDPESRRVQVTLSAEEGSPTESVEILDCDQRALLLEVRTGQGSERWQLELHIETRDEGSELVFRMPGLDPQMASSVGPGWEFYLDRLVAAVNGKDAGLVVFEPDYYPGLSDYYKALFNS